MRALLVAALLASPALATLSALEAPILVASSGLFGLIDPTLQPADFYERYHAVVILTVTAVDVTANRVELTVVQVCKGQFEPKKVLMQVTGDELKEAFISLMGKDVTVTAFIGKARKPEEILFYAGGEGRWQIGTLAAPNNPGAWNWTQDLGAHGPASHFGVFNGSAERFAEMMADIAAGRVYFPAHSIDRFQDDLTLDHLDAPIRGVALYDINSDGRLDVYACCPAGDRLYLQAADGTFADHTLASGLTGVASASVSFADTDADADADLLLDGVLWLQDPGGKFFRSDFLGPAAAAQVKMSCFVELNGDGYPDVLVSHRSGGLTVYRNPGAAGGLFTDLTVEAGLDQPACGAGGTGWVMHGDWMGDHRPTLFYSSGGGFLLSQDENGRFSPVVQTLGYDFTADGQSSGLTGAGCFAPVWRSGRPDMVFTRDTGLNLAIHADGERPMDGVLYGNELQLASQDQLPVIAEDLNADGLVDIYLGSRGGRSNMYYANRGYGSFMLSDRQNPGLFPGPAHQQGAWGLAAGDANNDGANDLLIGGVDGTLSLVLNDCLAQRHLAEHPNAVERVLDGVHIACVRVAGPIGVLGATVTLAAADGRVLGRRDIGSNIATGCRSPDTVNLAVREPGAHLLTVRWADGLTRRWTLDMGPEAVVVQNLTAERTGGQEP